MKTILFFLVLGFGSLVYSQTILKTESNYFDAVDKWAAYPLKDSVNTYICGFIFIDPDKGFTFDIAKKFALDDKGNFQLKKDQPDVSKGPIRFSIPKQFGKIHILTEQKTKELGLPTTPSWLNSFKQNESSPEYQIKIAAAYNRAGIANKSIEILQKLYQTNPNTLGLSFELAFAHNVLKQYDKAIEISERDLQKNPKNCLLYKEQLYAYRSLKQMDKAENVFKTASTNCTDKNFKTEMGISIAQSYFGDKNEAKLKEWITATRKLVKKDDQYDKFLHLMEAEWEKVKTKK